MDINPKCAEVLNTNKKKFPVLDDTDIPIVVGSILEDQNLKKLTQYIPKYDIVHSWGVLHHTGQM